MTQFPKEKLTIIGGGIIAAMEAYYAYQTAKKNGEKIHIVIYEKNKSHLETTTAHLVPTLSIDAILSVVPREDLLAKLKLPFNLGGVMIEDVKGVNDSDSSRYFIEQALSYNKNDNHHEEREKMLLSLGKMSMDLWHTLYHEADAKLKSIMEKSNFNDCHEQNGDFKLHDGYRIDLIYNVKEALQKANKIKEIYQKLGYHHCKILTPKDVMDIDPYLNEFYLNNMQSHMEWKDNAAAVWRPGGCLDAQIFLPAMYQYLQEELGNCFELKLGEEVVGVSYANDNRINGLKISHLDFQSDDDVYEKSNYIFCPGESVGTLKKLGFEEPAYGIFAGASLMLNIPMSSDKSNRFKDLNHCMEVHYKDIILAWQARIKNNQLFIGVAGTKGYYGDQKPEKNQLFGKDRNLLQLNMINHIFPELISSALEKNTKNQELSWNDLLQLESLGVVERNVSSRAVAADGFPTLGYVVNANGKVENGRCTTHLSSGGVSFAPAAVKISRSVFDTQPGNSFFNEILNYADSARKY